MSYLIAAYALTFAGLGYYARSLQRERVRLGEAAEGPSGPDA